jgi:acyl-CoA synthetase (AMP-forming)/AMP-acid ligase II
VAPVITEWFESPRAGHGIYLADDADGWSFHEYPPTWVAGGTLCTVADPLLQPADEYAANLAALLKEAEPAVVVTTSEYGDAVRQDMVAAGRDDAPWLYREEPGDLPPQPTGEIAVLQFTSGSTGSPRAACVSWTNLAANLKVITRVLGWRDGDGIASWLPLYHDLGLLGCLMTVVATQGHGRPEPSDGVSVTIIGEDGEGLPDEHLGEIAVTGDAVTGGYVRGRTGGSPRFADGQLRTGDAGFVHDGDIYVVGRMGNSLKIRGRSVYVEDLDAAVANATGLSRGRLSVVGSQDGGQPKVVLFVEAPPGEWAGAARRALRNRVGTECPITIVSGRAGLVQRTSGGKPQRRRMWETLQNGLPESAQILEDPADAGPA